MTEPLSPKDTGYPVITLLVMCVPISMKTNNDANNSHIESYLFPRHLPSLATLDRWILAKYIMIVDAA